MVGAIRHSVRVKSELCWIVSTRTHWDVPHGGLRALGLSAIELLTERPQLALLELADGEAGPPAGGPDEGRTHQLQDGGVSRRRAG